MCGILGVFNRRQHHVNIEVPTFLSAMALMEYRGPDARAHYVDPKQCLLMGHLRLSIHDLTDAGTQPMHLDTANGMYTIVFNGEVYNFHEIKDELVALGYSFSTSTDTEVVLAAYAAWGEACLSKFNGMFALAIYNHSAGTLFLARDRLGKKPLYYYHDKRKDQFCFSSEIKSILALYPELADQDIDPVLLDAYFTLGYTPGAQTLYMGINRLLPGHKLTISSDEIKELPFWKLNFKGKKNHPENESQLIETGKSLFKDSLKLRLRSDVDVGVFLSGGLDSSAVVAGLSEQGISLNTYSVRFDGGAYGDQFDETKFADIVSARFNTNHHTITMSPTLFRDSIPGFVSLMDEPVTEAAAISLGLVSKLAARDVTVVLSGEGSDEIFGGYELYQRMQKMEKIRQIITPLGAKVAGALSSALPAGSKVRKYAQLTAQPFEQRYRGISVFPGFYRDMLYKDHMKDALKKSNDHILSAFYENLFSASKGQTLLSRMLHFDTHTWLVDDLLIKADRMSMSHSLELRCPFLDYRLVDFASNLPDNMKIRKGDPKWILKQWFKDSLPDCILSREKLGFPTPLQRMFMGPLKEYVCDVLLNKNASISKYVKLPIVEKLCSEHFSGNADHHAVLWQLVVLEEYLVQRKRIASQFSSVITKVCA